MGHSFLLFAATDMPPLAWNLRIPLSILNFLEFAIWGAWFVVLGNYLNNLQFSRKDIGRIYATMSLGSVIAPMFGGTIADRFFASEQLMGVLHLIGGVLLIVMARIKSPRPFYWAALAYALVYSPTLALVNSVGFAHIPDAARDFPTIRVLGTIGWIAAGLSLRFLIPPGQPVNNRPLLLASVLSFILGAYSFFLPHTPPPASGSGAVAEAVLAAEQIVGVKITNQGSGYQTAPNLTVRGGGGAGAELKAKVTDKQTVGEIEIVKGGKGYTSAPSIDFPSGEIPFIRAIELLKEPSFAVFFGVSFLITLALAFYYSFTALFLENALHVRPENIGPVMTVAQWVEIIFMFTLPWFLTELGMKWVLAIGMAAWGVRYAIFASRGPLPLILVGIGLHGICFDFFFAAGFIHVQNTAPPEIQASGQSLFAVLTYGLGMWLGTEASGWLNQWFTRETVDADGKMVKVTDWTKFWLVPCVGVLISLVLFLAFFNIPHAASN